MLDIASDEDFVYDNPYVGDDPDDDFVEEKAPGRQEVGPMSIPELSDLLILSWHENTLIRTMIDTLLANQADLHRTMGYVTRLFDLPDLLEGKHNIELTPVLAHFGSLAVTTPYHFFIFFDQLTSQLATNVYQLFRLYSDLSYEMDMDPFLVSYVSNDVEPESLAMTFLMALRCYFSLFRMFNEFLDMVVDYSSRNIIDDPNFEIVDVLDLYRAKSPVYLLLSHYDNTIDHLYMSQNHSLNDVLDTMFYNSYVSEDTNIRDMINTYKDDPAVYHYITQLYLYDNKTGEFSQYPVDLLYITIMAIRLKRGSLF